MLNQPLIAYEASIPRSKFQCTVYDVSCFQNAVISIYYTSKLTSVQEFLDSTSTMWYYTIIWGHHIASSSFYLLQLKYDVAKVSKDDFISK